MYGFRVGLKLRKLAQLSALSSFLVVASVLVASCAGQDDAEGTGSSADATVSSEATSSQMDAEEKAAPSAGQSDSERPRKKPTPTPEPVVTVETEEVAEAIPFDTVYRDDSSLEKGENVVTTHGADGVRTLTYEVEFTDGVETSRTLVDEEITEEPTDEIITEGTYEPEPETDCDPNYGGGCVPIDSDVDCAGGSGNGPSYVQGPVAVIGADIYGLDANGDGVGCE